MKIVMKECPDDRCEMEYGTWCERSKTFERPREDGIIEWCSREGEVREDVSQEVWKRCLLTRHGAVAGIIL